MISWLRDLFRRHRGKAKRPAEIRELLVDARAARLAKLAKREGMTIDEFDDALSLLARQYPVTIDEVVAVVERHGLAGAQRELKESTDADA